MVKILKKICFLIVLFILGFNTVNASGNYTISLSSNSVTKGKSVTLYIKGNNLNGGFIVSSSNSTVASLSSTQVWLDNNTQTVTINSLNTGSVTITVTPTQVSTADCASGNCDLNLAAKTLTLKVNNSTSSNNSSPSQQNDNNNSQTEKSNDVTLKSLNIDNANISPEFKSDILEYNVEVESGVEKLKINATPNNNKATVSGAGEVTVKEGLNKISISVTAEDGSRKTYTINITVKEKEPIIVKINGKNYTIIRKEEGLPEVDLFEKTKVKIGEEEVAAYYNSDLKIYLVGLRDDKNNIGMYIYDTDKNTYTRYNWITVGGVTLYLKDAPKKLENFTKYKETINNISIDLYKLNNNEKIGLIYGTNVKTGNTGWYIYDKDDETLARYYNKEVDIYKNKISNYKNYLMIFMVLVSVIILLLISLITNKKIKKKKTKSNK